MGIIELDALRNNTEYVNMNDPDYDTFTLKDVEFNKKYTPAFPHLINDHLPQPIFNNLTVKNIRSALPAPIVYIIDKYGLVLCGGHMYKLFIKEMEYNGNFDIDLFIVDKNKDPKYLSEKIDNIIAYLVDTKCCRFIKHDRHVIELIIDFESRNIIETTKVQIILSVYDTPSQIIHGFDIGSCCVAFDGKEVYFTSMGKFAYEYGFNIVMTDRISPTYEYRLKKYFKRGFGIILPNFNLEYGGNSILNYLYSFFVTPKMSNFKIQMSNIEINGAKVYGNTILVNQANFKVPLVRKSDYEDIRIDATDIARLSKHNYHILTADDNPQLISIQTPEWGSKYIQTFNRNSLIPRVLYNKLDNLQNKLIEKILDGNNVTTNINNKLDDEVNRQINQYRKKIIKDGYSFNFIKVNGQQYGQFNTVDMSPQEWYGQHFKPL
jgi:hypothetical protein